MIRWVRACALGIFVFLGIGCNSSYNKVMDSAEINTVNTCGAPSADFATVEQKVLKPYCASCHGSSGAKAGVNVENFNAVKNNISRIETQIASGGMPSGSTLPPSLKTYILNWIKAGAPQTATAGSTVNCQNPGQNEPTAAPSPKCEMPPDFTTVQQKVFEPQCAECHDGSSIINVNTYGGVLAKIGMIQSSIESGSMPPAAGLKKEDRRLVLDWIQAGAPDIVSLPPNCPNPLPSGPATFASISQRVLGPRCARCHGNAAGINVQTYENVLADLALIRSEIQSGSMPPNGPLNDLEKKYVLDWIRAGAPK